MNEWISVSDKKPDHTEWVLVYGDGAMACRAWNAKIEQFEDWQECATPGLFLESITHWMSLPDPPITEDGLERFRDE